MITLVNGKVERKDLLRELLDVLALMEDIFPDDYDSEERLDEAYDKVQAIKDLVETHGVRDE